MSDALPLPPRPNLEQYRKLAKDFQRACKSSDPAAIRTWLAQWAENLARLQRREITPEARMQIENDSQRFEHRWRKFQKKNPRAQRCSLADAQFFVARAHGFSSWPKFIKHLEGLAQEDSSVARFEAAVDAIISGDAATLGRMLREHQDLVRTRSTREHRSTLLHYVSANGIEDFRQKTPRNIVEVTRMLLDAGADVNAESDAYAGHSTTLGLAATSCHPQDAGVQIPLLELLIERGALVDGPDSGSGVNACLHNGRGEAAEFLANHGARLDLEGAAGAGKLEAVKSFFQADGSLRPPATREQMLDGFAWACEFGRTSVIEYLLQHGMTVDTRLRRHGETGLHWAALEAQTETVKLLLDRKAAVNTLDGEFEGTPLGWALYSWAGKPNDHPKARSYYETVALLVAAGAKVDPEWLDHPNRETLITQRINADAKMIAALRGET